jgi:hypothetical protein
MNKPNLIDALSTKENLTEKMQSRSSTWSLMVSPIRSRKVAEVKSGDLGACL